MKTEEIYLEAFAKPLVRSQWLTAAVVILGIALAGTLGLDFYTLASARSARPYIVRINQIGQAQAVEAGTERYIPQAPEIRYFLSRFCELYFGRNRYTIRRDLPDSLWFFDAPHAEQISQSWASSKTIENFINDPRQPEIDIKPVQVSVGDLTKPPYQARIDFQEIVHGSGDSQTKTFTAYVVFTRLQKVPASMVAVNPLGFSIISLHLDQAMSE